MPNGIIESAPQRDDPPLPSGVRRHDWALPLQIELQLEPSELQGLEIPLRLIDLLHLQERYGDPLPRHNQPAPLRLISFVRFLEQNQHEPQSPHQ